MCTNRMCVLHTCDMNIEYTNEPFEHIINIYFRLDDKMSGNALAKNMFGGMRCKRGRTNFIPFATLVYFECC